MTKNLVAALLVAVFLVGSAAGTLSVVTASSLTQDRVGHPANSVIELANLL